MVYNVHFDCGNETQTLWNAIRDVFSFLTIVSGETRVQKFLADSRKICETCKYICGGGIV